MAPSACLRPGPGVRRPSGAWRTWPRGRAGRARRPGGGPRRGRAGSAPRARSPSPPASGDARLGGCLLHQHPARDDAVAHVGPASASRERSRSRAIASRPASTSGVGRARGPAASPGSDRATRSEQLPHGPGRATRAWPRPARGRPGPGPRTTSRAVARSDDARPSSDSSSRVGARWCWCRGVVRGRPTAAAAGGDHDRAGGGRPDQQNATPSAATETMTVRRRLAVTASR